MAASYVYSDQYNSLHSKGLNGDSLKTIHNSDANTLYNKVVKNDRNRHLGGQLILGITVAPLIGAVGGGAKVLVPAVGKTIQQVTQGIKALNGSGVGNEGGSSAVDDIIRDGSQLENGKLKPNVKYQTGEFKYNYETDTNGRISNCNTDDLQLTEREYRLSYDSKTPGKIEGDHAGHLAGDRFGGSPEIDNIVSQTQNVNLSQYKKLENQWANSIKNGKKVNVNVNIKYDGDGLRPTEFNMEYTIDGKYYIKDILN